MKEEAQLDMQTPHRARSRLVNGRTRLTNQLRAILIERGITVAKGRRALGLALEPLLDGTESGLKSKGADAALIPTCADLHPWAHSRIPMDMIFHGRSVRLFQASQQRATMSS